jgi:hypothetical protein
MSPTSYRCSTSRCGRQNYAELTYPPNKSASFLPIPAFSRSGIIIYPGINLSGGSSILIPICYYMIWARALQMAGQIISMALYEAFLTLLAPLV